MLQSLYIKNVALISDLSIEFGKGFNVLIGETGAGKSIIFDALNFVLGAKIDKSLLRSGETNMRVDALFVNINEDAQNLLNQFGFEGDEIVLSRTYSLDGKSVIRINGLLSTQSILKEIGDILVNSYSQHESTDLLKVKNHLMLLDKFGGQSLTEAKKEVLNFYDQLQEIKGKLNKLGGNDFERERTRSLLAYQIKEIEEAKLIIGEDEQLHERLRFLNNAEKIYETISECESLLSENYSSCINNLQQASSNLSSISGFSDIDECKERLDSARYEIEDIYQTLLSIKSSTEFDKDEFELLDQRNDLIKSLVKKYGGSIEKTLEFLEEAKKQYTEIENSTEIIEQLEIEKSKVEKELLLSAKKLTEIRKKVAEDIINRLSGELQELGMKSSKFEISFRLLDEITSNGQDNVEFIFSANKGQELKSLSKTASGGELSRFMLAFKNIFAQANSAQTFIFDEIDAGISGETGNIVGQKLKKLACYGQVLCITHLPQVACYGDDFFYITKKEVEDTTITNVEHLKPDQIDFHIAKLMGGDNVSDIALSHVKEMRQNIIQK